MKVREGGDLGVQQYAMKRSANGFAGGAEKRAKQGMLVQASTAWQHSSDGTMLFLYPPGAVHGSKIAGFDMDWTVIKTKSGKTFGENSDDWMFWSSEVQLKLQQLVADGVRVVFFTNQRGIGGKGGSEGDFTRKMEAVISRLGLSNQITVMASLEKSIFRKPATGMWDHLCRCLSGDATPSRAKSVYVGDAAGRPKTGSRKKDFSASDLKFALNIGGGIKFATPEQYFKGSTDRLHCSRSIATLGFVPTHHWNYSQYNQSGDFSDGGSSSSNSAHFLAQLSPALGTRVEVVVLVGSPASGKSSFTVQHISSAAAAKKVEFVRVNQDTLGSKTVCLQAVKQSLESGKSAIVDNTNRDRKTRKNYIEIAKRMRVPCRCIWLTTKKEESFHLNSYRRIAGSEGDGTSIGSSAKEMRLLPDMVIHSYYKNLEPPTREEGFEQIIETPFVPDSFASDEHRRLFFKFMP